MHVRKIAAVGALAATLVGCDDLPDRMLNEAERVRSEVGATAAATNDKAAELDTFLAQTGCIDSGQKAQFRKTLGVAQSAMSDATELEADRLKPLLEEDDGDKEAQVRTVLSRMRQKASTARDALGDLSERVRTVKSVRDNPGGYLDRARSRATEIGQMESDARAMLAKARDAFPDRDGDFVDREAMARVLNAGERASELKATVEREVAGSANSGGFNCATVADAYLKLDELSEDTPDAFKTAKTNFAALHRTEERVLMDQKAVYTVQVGRTTWDWSGGSEINMTFEPTQVPADTFQYVVDHAKKRDSRLAFKDKNWDDVRPEIPQEHWRHIAPGNPLVNWPNDRNHDEASFWPNDWNWNHFHKYRIISDNGQEVTDWVSVDSNVYDRYSDALGMTIASKKAGQFPDEAMTTPAPPGMNLVGDERYGEWREAKPEGMEEQPQTETASGGGMGNALMWWYFMGGFNGLNTPYGDDRYAYSQRSHRTWQNNYAGRKPYYGMKTSAGNRPFGTRGSFTRSTGAFQSSTFAKTGGVRTNSVPSSVRGAGPAGRGGGPARGGK